MKRFSTVRALLGLTALLPSFAAAQATVPNYEFSSVAVDYPVSAGNPNYSLQGTLGQTFATVDPPTNTGQTLAYAGFQETYVPFAYVIQAALTGYVSSANPAVIYGQTAAVPFSAELFSAASATVPANVPTQTFFADAMGKVKVLSPLKPAFAQSLSLKAPLWLRKNTPLTPPADPINGYPTGSVTLGGGDAVNDNKVDLNDFGVLVNAFGSDVTISGSGYSPFADFNQDGSVNLSDFGLLVNNFGNLGDL